MPKEYKGEPVYVYWPCVSSPWLLFEFW